MALEQARLATLALTRATASTANEPMLVPGQIADALGHLLVIYLIAVEVAVRGMSDLLLAVLERLPVAVRRLVVAVGALLALGAVMAALTLTAPHGGRQRRAGPAAAGLACVSSGPRRAGSRRPSQPAAIVQARRVAERFLAGYLPFAYGRGSALAVSGITSALRRQLLQQAG